MLSRCARTLASHWHLIVHVFLRKFSCDVDRIVTLTLLVVIHATRFWPCGTSCWFAAECDRSPFSLAQHFASRPLYTRRSSKQSNRCPLQRFGWSTTWSDERSGANAMKTARTAS